MPELSIDGGETFIAFNLDTVTDDEAIELEDAFGMPWLAFLNGLNAGSIKSQKALVWLAQHRDNPDLKPNEVVYEIAKFEVRTDDEEAVPLSEGDAASNDSVTSESSPTS